MIDAFKKLTFNEYNILEADIYTTDIKDESNIPFYSLHDGELCENNDEYSLEYYKALIFN